MTKVHTLIFYSQEINNTVSVEIYVAPVDKGYWNLDSNKVVLNSLLYSHFRDCKTQREQRQFFDALQKISQQVLT
jgi:hypothetical protein